MNSYKVNLKIKPHMCRGDRWPQEIDVEFICKDDNIEKIIEIMKEEMPEYFKIGE